MPTVAPLHRTRNPFKSVSTETLSFIKPVYLMHWATAHFFLRTYFLPLDIHWIQAFRVSVLLKEPCKKKKKVRFCLEFIMSLFSDQPLP